MIEKHNSLPPNTVTLGEVSVEQAKSYRTRDYKGKTFACRCRMERIERFERRFAQYLLDMVGNNAHILDIPCGNGRFFEVFSKVKSLIMADYSMNMLEAVGEKFGTQKNVRLIQADILSIPISDGSVDLCFCMRLFHHMKSDQVRLDALKELARISNKYVALSFYNKNCLRYYWRKALGKKIRGNYVTFAHIVNMAKQVGLELIERFPKRNLLEQQCLVIFKKG